MKTYMVCVDGSGESHEAFQAALDLVKAGRSSEPGTTLIVLAVVEHTATVVGSGLGGMHAMVAGVDNERQLERKYRQLLASYALRCQDEGVNKLSLLGTTADIGTFVCKMIEKYNVDCVVVGRRGVGRAYRFFLGSVSNYVMEHAKCNVLLARSSGASEIHASLRMIDRMEERERQRRTQEGNVDVAHDATVDQIKQAEEQERQRRVQEAASGTDERVSAFRQNLNQNVMQQLEKKKQMAESKQSSAVGTPAAEQLEKKHQEEHPSDHPQFAGWFKAVQQTIESDASHDTRKQQHEQQTESVQLEHD